jgi:tRNA A-37 threonylcarbamoyl transferase component Bud32
MGKSTFVDANTVDVDALGATILPFTEDASSPAGAGAALPNGDGRYARGKALGQGGMGTVFEATDRQFGRTVALKQADATGAAAMARFSVEALVTANLEHPGVTPVYDRGVNPEGKPFYTMARVQGRTLADLIAEAKTIEARLKLLPVLVRVAQTLAYAHERGVIHRDIKPDNIIVGRHGEAYVLDWGIAKVRGLKATDRNAAATDHRLVLDEATTTEGATRMGSVLGTPAYMAPEQAAGRVDEVDERTDVFALGALLYHVTTGRPPYDGPTLRSIVDQALAANAPAASTLAPDIPPAVHRVIERAMARSRDERFQSAAEVATALENTMTDALTDKRSPAVRVAINALTVAAGFVIVAAGAFIATHVSTFGDQGWSAEASVILFAASLCIIGIEWRTRGRYDLSSTILVFTALTLLIAVGGTVSGVEAVLQLLRTEKYATDLPGWHLTLAEGLWEALGAIPTAAVYASTQLILWITVRRRNAEVTLSAARHR